MAKLKDIRFVDDKECKPYEYFCHNCKQLRLAFVVVNKCSNCGSSVITKGKIGSVRKE